MTGLAVGVALTIWFRGCDPGLRGKIASIDQILPYYVNTYLVHIPGFLGLFLAGIIFMMAYNSVTSAFVGLCLLAVLFPFVHSKATDASRINARDKEEEKLEGAPRNVIDQIIAARVQLAFSGPIRAWQKGPSWRATKRPGTRTPRSSICSSESRRGSSKNTATMRFGSPHTQRSSHPRCSPQPFNEAALDEGLMVRELLKKGRLKNPTLTEKGAPLQLLEDRRLSALLEVTQNIALRRQLLGVVPPLSLEQQSQDASGKPSTVVPNSEEMYHSEENAQSIPGGAGGSPSSLPDRWTPDT
ncbi:hypothetical protein MTO96_031967 [Rhipicephalus appendiculatus]